jgi:ElaB/YqjD/DUF883 family membrane-anchored ribosome-binding protein
MVAAMKTTREQVNEDIAAVKSDVRRVRADVAGMVHSAKSRGKDMTMEMGGRIRDVMSDLRSKATDEVRSRSEALKDRGYETVESWRGGIEERPITALLVAFAAGFVIASFISRGRRVIIKNVPD